MQVNMTRDALGIMAICSLRYCFGRKTYMPTTIIDACRKMLGEFSKKDLTVMINDCEYRRRNYTYEDEFDEEAWRKWEDDLIAERDRRAYKT